MMLQAASLKNVRFPRKSVSIIELVDFGKDALVFLLGNLALGDVVQDRENHVPVAQLDPSADQKPVRSCPDFILYSCNSFRTDPVFRASVAPSSCPSC